MKLALNSCRHGFASWKRASWRGCKAQCSSSDNGCEVWPWLQRSELIMGDQALVKLASAKVMVVGMGGVGSWCAEMLCRSGVGHLVLIDGDDVDSTNRNRQLPALATTIGQSKVQVMRSRLLSINPELIVTARNEFLEPDAATELALEPTSFVVDCIDSLAPKQALVVGALQQQRRIISSMGAGGKIDPSRVQVTDIARTHDDKIARELRAHLRKVGISSDLPVVFSSEAVRKGSMQTTHARFKRSYYGTMSYMPAVFGMHAAAHVIQELTDCGQADRAIGPRLSRQERRRRNRAAKAARLRDLEACTHAGPGAAI